jgi:hypothetical protein
MTLHFCTCIPTNTCYEYFAALTRLFFEILQREGAGGEG